MPYLHRFTRVTISGTSFNGAEEWSTGFNIGAEGEDATLPTQEQADNVRDAWRTFFISNSSYISNRWASTLVKLSSVGTDGKSSAANTVFAEFPVETKGASVDSWPPQIALVATLTSQAARGVASKGRMYLPGVSAGIDASGHIATLARDEIWSNVKTMLVYINAYAGTPNNILLTSPGSLNADGTPKIGGSAPLSKSVTGVRVGNVYDTQRRRRNQLAEVYKSGPLE